MTRTRLGSVATCCLLAQLWRWPCGADGHRSRIRVASPAPAFTYLSAIHQGQFSWPHFSDCLSSSARQDRCEGGSCPRSAAPACCRQSMALCTDGRGRWRCLPASGCA